MSRSFRPVFLVSCVLFGSLLGSTRNWALPFDIQLVATGAGQVGTNWISLPNGTSIKTAEQLCAAIGPNATSVAQFFPDVNRRYTWSCAGGAGACTTTNPGGTIPEPGCAASACFCIDGGEGLEVKVSAPTSLQVDGCESPASIALPAGSAPGPGMNYLASVPYATSLVTWNDLALAAGLPSTGLPRGTVTGIDPVSGLFTTCQAGTAACTSALLVTGRAYRLTYLTATPAPYTNPTSAGPCVQLVATGAGQVGTNWISLPNATPIKTAEQLCAAIGPNATSVAQFFPDVNRRYTWSCAGGAGACTTTNPGGTIPEPGCAASACFCIDDGEGLEVKVSAPTSFHLDGCESPVSIALPAGSAPSPGMNYLASVPYATSLVTWNDLALAAGLPSTGLPRGTVTGIDPVSGLFTTCQAGTASCTAALLVTGRAYRLGYLTATPAPYTNPTTSAGPCVDFDINLIAVGAGLIGTNWISLPVSTPIRTAEDLCAAIGPNAISVAQFFPDVNRRFTWTCAGGPSACVFTNLAGVVPEPGCPSSACFCIDDGEAYEIKVSADTPLHLAGCESQVPITLPAGSTPSPGMDYLASVPYATSLVSWNDLALAAGLPSTGIQRGLVTGINPVSGIITTCQAGTAACTAALLVPGRAYRLRYPTAAPAAYGNPTTRVAPCFTCGNGVIEAFDEQCDDGNVGAGDCCSPVCRFDRPATSCGPAGAGCTSDLCNGAGDCAHTGIVEPVAGTTDPLRVTGYDAATGEITFTHEQACVAFDYTIYWGSLTKPWSAAYNGQACNVGCSRAVTFNPAADSIFFFIVPHDGLDEGSYGQDSTGAEVPEAVGLPVCDYPQDLGNVCQ